MRGQLGVAGKGVTQCPVLPPAKQLLAAPLRSARRAPFTLPHTSTLPTHPQVRFLPHSTLTPHHPTPLPSPGRCPSSRPNKEPLHSQHQRPHVLSLDALPQHVPRLALLFLRPLLCPRLAGIPQGPHESGQILQGLGLALLLLCADVLGEQEGGVWREPVW